MAAYAIESFSRPGAVVVDPDCGCGVVLVEALRAGRHAVGMTADYDCWQVVRANLTAAKRAGAWPDGVVLDAGAHESVKVRAAGLDRRADLVLTAIGLLAVIDGRSPDSDLESGIEAKVRMWTSLLRPGGHAVVILGSHRLRDGTLLDASPVVFGAAVACGLIPVDRCIALTDGWSGKGVAQRGVPGVGVPIASVAHHTALVLRAPEVSEHINDGQPPVRMVVRSRNEPPARSDVA